MRYLQSQPFTVGLGTKKYSEGWDRIWKKEKPDDLHTRATEPPPPPEPPKEKS